MKKIIGILTVSLSMLFTVNCFANDKGFGDSVIKWDIKSINLNTSINNKDFNSFIGELSNNTDNEIKYIGNTNNNNGTPIAIFKKPFSIPISNNQKTPIITYQIIPAVENLIQNYKRDFFTEYSETSIGTKGFISSDYNNDSDYKTIFIKSSIKSKTTIRSNFNIRFQHKCYKKCDSNYSQNVLYKNFSNIKHHNGQKEFVSNVNDISFVDFKASYRLSLNNTIVIKLSNNNLLLIQPISIKTIKNDENFNYDFNEYFLGNADNKNQAHLSLYNFNNLDEYNNYTNLKK